MSEVAGASARAFSELESPFLPERHGEARLLSGDGPSTLIADVRECEGF